MKATIIPTVLLVVTIIGTAYSQNLATPLSQLNINYMNRGYFYASSPYFKRAAGLGGWADDENMFLKIEDISRFLPNTLSIQVRHEEKGVFAGQYLGTRLYVANTSPDTIFFEAQDSRLNMKLQAIDKNGRWKDIEYLPSSWCGNSYHMVYLPSQHYWVFTIPQYEGKIKTRLRAILLFKKGIDGDEEEIFSNEFEGSVNLGQFTKKPAYRPNGIMDPYDE